MNLPLPIIPGVYRFEWTTGGHELAQLDVNGHWWPFPYLYSEWRASELSTFHSVRQTNRTMDCPASSELGWLKFQYEERAEQIRYLTSKRDRKIVKNARLAAKIEELEGK